MSMMVTPRIIQEDFVDPLPQDLESLFLEEDEVSAEIVIEGKGLLAANMSRELRSICIGSQGSDQGTQAEVPGSVKDSVLLEITSTSVEARIMQRFLKYEFIH